MKTKVLLIGGRSKARSLALSLLEKGYSVTVINENHGDCMKLAEIDGLNVIHGDGSKPFVLEDASAGSAALAIALTSKDEDNLVICQLCKKRFGIPKTVSLVSDPQKMDFFYKMGVDSVVCAIRFITGIIEQQAFMNEIATLLPFGQGRIRIAQVSISDSSPVVGKKLWELDLPQQAIIGCILRGENTLIPRGDTGIFAGDMLVLLSGGDQEMAAIHKLTGRGER